MIIIQDTPVSARFLVNSRHDAIDWQAILAGASAVEVTREQGQAVKSWQNAVTNTGTELAPVMESTGNRVVIDGIQVLLLGPTAGGDTPVSTIDGVAVA